MTILQTLKTTIESCKKQHTFRPVHPVSKIKYRHALDFQTLVFAILWKERKKKKLAAD